MTRRAVHRRGGVYLLVLACVLSATIICIGGIAISRTHTRAATDLRNAEEARQLARSAVEYGIHLIHGEANWRTARPNGVWVTGHALGRGTIEVRITDADGSLSDDPYDEVTITGVGTVGRARQLFAAALEPEATPIDSLACALASHGSIGFGAGSSTIANATISTNASASATLASIDAPVEASGHVSGLTYKQSTKSGVAAKTIPSGTAVVAAYEVLGTSFNFSAIPSGIIENTAMGPGLNPYGAADPRGIYIIDCKGSDVRLRNCRIVGTLVFKNASDVRIDDLVAMEAYEEGLPVLVSDRDIQVTTDSGSLSEASLGVNFNPKGLGVGLDVDADKLDTYPAGLRGLVYAGRNLDVSGPLAVEGAVIVRGSVATGSSLVVQHDPNLLIDPPPGFWGTPFMRLRHGSWRRHAE